MIVLAVDPGLTRCGIGVVQSRGQKLSLLGVDVLKTNKEIPLEQRLISLHNEFENWVSLHKPDVVTIERVFSQLNVSTAMGTAQAAAAIMLVAAQHGIPVVHHTPSEVKAAVTGSGRADKKQVAAMVVKILGLKEIPKPVDATDALALAICHHWRGVGDNLINKAVNKSKKLQEEIKVKAKTPSTTTRKKALKTIATSKVLGVRQSKTHKSGI